MDSGVALFGSGAENNIDLGSFISRHIFKTQKYATIQNGIMMCGWNTENRVNNGPLYH